MKTVYIAVCDACGYDHAIVYTSRAYAEKQLNGRFPCLNTPSALGAKHPKVKVHKIRIVSAKVETETLTVRQAMVLCAKLEVPMYDAGMGYKAISAGAREMATKLSRTYPPHRFRVIQCHDREYTYPAFTVKKPDPREYEEMRKRGEWINGEYRRFKKKV